MKDHPQFEQKREKATAQLWRCALNETADPTPLQSAITLVRPEDPR